MYDFVFAWTEALSGFSKLVEISTSLDFRLWTYWTEYLLGLKRKKNQSHWKAQKPEFSLR